jgi:hypothetical protein
VFIIFNPTNSSWSGFRANYFAGEWCEVTSISGSVVTVRSQLYDTYNAADVDVYKVSSPKMALRNFEIRGGSTSGLIRATLCIAPVFENITAIHANNIALFLERCFKASVINPNINNPGAGGNDYGIAVSNSQHIRVIGGYVFSRRHSITHGGGDRIGSVTCRDSRIIGCVLKNDVDSLVFNADVHGNSEDCSFIDCTIYGGATFQGKDITYHNCIITADVGGIVLYNAEIKGGFFTASDCRFITHVDPQPSGRGIVDFGGNSSDVVTSNTVLNCTFSIKDCELYARNLSATTSVMIMRNRGATVKTNMVIDGLTANVNAMGQMLFTSNVSGTPDADFIIVDRVSGFPSGTRLHNASGNDYANFPHRCQRQTGSEVVTITSGTSNTSTATTAFKYRYPRQPSAQVSILSTIIGNRYPLPLFRELTDENYRFRVISPDTTNFTATADAKVFWSAQIDDI